VENGATLGLPGNGNRPRFHVRCGELDRATLSTLQGPASCNARYVERRGGRIRGRYGIDQAAAGCGTRGTGGIDDLSGDNSRERRQVQWRQARRSRRDEGLRGSGE